MRAGDPSTGVVRRVRVFAVLACVAVVAGCGAADTSAGSDRRRDGEGTSTTTATTMSPTTLVSPTSTAPASGNAIFLSDVPVCDRSGASYSTAPDWVSDPLPEGMRMEVAQTGANAAADAPPARSRTWLLADIEGDRVVGLISLGRAGAPPGLSGGGVDPPAPVVDGVRGRPGRIETRVDRSAMPLQVAEWTEHGETWTASSTLDAHSLGAAIEPVVIDGDAVRDPTGRFEVIGAGPPYAAGRSRVTQLEVVGPGPDRLRHYVRIDDPVPGATGITTLPPGLPQPAVGSVDGRLVVLNPQTAVTTTADGSPVWIDVYDETSNAARINPDVLSVVLSSLRRRTAADDAWMADVPLVVGAGASDVALSGHCREE